ncbi:MAG TPA: hypothetical protein VFK47_07870, partial [Ktedonobacteraceae bacterium]|nr:hypothetical protein [Ktedonobacteraceae bacterium]
SLLGFRVANCLDGEAWFCRKTSLKVEMVTNEAGASSEFRGADSTTQQECNLRALKNSPASFMVEYHMPKKNRKVAKDHVINFANGYPK